MLENDVVLIEHIGANGVVVTVRVPASARVAVDAESIARTHRAIRDLAAVVGARMERPD